jgi:hypothetical protein
MNAGGLVDLVANNWKSTTRDSADHEHPPVVGGKHRGERREDTGSV